MQRRAIRLQHAHRMRIESNHRGALPGGARALPHRLQNFLVPEVKPVKISDRNGRAPRVSELRRPLLDGIENQKSHQTRTSK